TGKGMGLETGPVARIVMIRMMQRLRHDASLECDVLRIARTGALIRTPTDGAMIDDTVVAGGKPGAIHRFAGEIADTEAHVTDDDVMRAESPGGKVCETNAVAGRGLAGHCAIGIMHGARAFEFDQAGNTKNDRARPIGFDRRAKAAGDDGFAFSGV